MKSPRKPYTSPVIRVAHFTLGVYGDYGDYDLQYTHPASSGEDPWQQLNQD